MTSNTVTDSLFIIYFICSLFNGVFQQLKTIQRRIKVADEWRIGKDVEGSGPGLIKGSILAVAWRDWGKPQKPSISINDIRSEIWTWDLPNTWKGC
jgi:hypothetical protein